MFPNIIFLAGICYARTVTSTEGFELPQNWLAWPPTCHRDHSDLMELAEKFVEEPCEGNRLFYLWGHSYEFDLHNNWDVIDEFARYIGGREDIWYATNMEIYDYATAFEKLQISGDGKAVYNPSAITLWVAHGGKTYRVKGRERVVL